MLKIKDEIDLKELEKFGFKPEYDINTGRLLIYKYSLEKEDSATQRTLLRINVGARELWFYSNYNIDIIYDLIKADLVEKVDDTNAN